MCYPLERAKGFKTSMEVNVYVSNSPEYMTNNYLKVGLQQVPTPISMKILRKACCQSVNRLLASLSPAVMSSSGPLNNSLRLRGREGIYQIN